MRNIRIRQVLLPSLAIALGLALGAPEAAEAQMSVIVGPSSSYAPTQAEVVKIFRGSMTTWSDGTKVQIVDQASTAVGEQFYSQVIGATSNSVPGSDLPAVLLADDVIMSITTSSYNDGPQINAVING